MVAHLAQPLFLMRTQLLSLALILVAACAGPDLDEAERQRAIAQGSAVRVAFSEKLSKLGAMEITVTGHAPIEVPYVR